MTVLQNLSLWTTRRRIFEAVAVGGMSVTAGAKLLGLTRQGFWHRRKQVRLHGSNAVLPRKPGPKPYSRAWNRVAVTTVTRVLELREQTAAGPTALAWHLGEEGIKISRSTVYRILIRQGIIDPARQGKPTYVRYTLGYPRAEIQYDWMQIEDAKGRFWVAAAVDDHTRWSFAKTYPRCNSANAIDFLAHIVTTAPFPINAVRTDQGSEVGEHFEQACQGYGISQIRNRVKTPRHNGKVERFHRTVQEECLYYHWHQDLTEIEAQYRLNQFLGFYNHQRPHQGLGMDNRPPVRQLLK